MPGLRAVIVGAGVGGLTTALALRAIGIEATVYERAPSLDAAQVGGGIHLWSNALHVYRHLGIADAIRAAGAEQGTAEFCSWRGPLLSRWPIGAISDRVGLPTVGVSRADLHPVLVDAVGAASIVTGAQCTGFTEEAGGVTARFADGREERADLLIGADGISSAVRAQLHGQQPHRYAGYTLWQAITDYPTDQAPADLFRVLWGRGRRFSYYRVGGGRLYWFVVANAPAREQDPERGKGALILGRLGPCHPYPRAAGGPVAYRWPGRLSADGSGSASVMPPPDANERMESAEGVGEESLWGAASRGCYVGATRPVPDRAGNDHRGRSPCNVCASTYI
jgi:2-polyprenyl-6-methoxyphenol hydroxylase-like FAD-dependent oxidoreductase